MASTSASASHTRAWTALRQNLDSIAHMVALVSREQAFLHTESTRFKRYMKRVSIEVARTQTLVGKSPALAFLPLQAAVAKLKLASERYKRIRQTRDERIGTVTLLQVVMLVTCVEAYLRDLLAISARVDPKLMDETQQVAPYADVISATSLDELASELRDRWTRKWLSDGGPTRWISRLKRMGARGYPDGHAPRWR